VQHKDEVRTKSPDLRRGRMVRIISSEVFFKSEHGVDGTSFKAIGKTEGTED
jgi:hypothetical protein